MQNRTPNFLVAESKAERALEHIKILEVRLKMLNARPDFCKSKSIAKQVQALEEMLRGYKEYYRLKKTQAEELLNEMHGKEPWWGIKERESIAEHKLLSPIAATPDPTPTLKWYLLGCKPDQVGEDDASHSTNGSFQNHFTLSKSRLFYHAA